MYVFGGGGGREERGEWNVKMIVCRVKTKNASTKPPAGKTTTTKPSMSSDYVFSCKEKMDTLLFPNTNDGVWVCLFVFYVFCSVRIQV